MVKRMLIDASMPDETRVVVVNNGQIEEADFELASKKPLKANIYLARVTRVEPSLQAAFVDYGGNRHGFLPFSEIHPDYYQMPVADREALLAEVEDRLDRERKAREDEEEDLEDEENGDEDSGPDTVDHPGLINEDEEENSHGEQPYVGTSSEDQGSDETASTEADENAEENTEENSDGKTIAQSSNSSDSISTDEEDLDKSEEPDAPSSTSAESDDVSKDATTEDDDDDSEVSYEQVAEHASDDDDESEDSSDDDAIDEEALRSRATTKAILERRYKIQEVIKRRQIILVQVTKEERGNKGAALTTYLSLAGRYCVLMPNTSKGGGISRKISSPKDRRKLKSILTEMDIPTGLSVIVRTAGSQRNKSEIKRDFEYLLRTWDEIREQTVQSTAPSLIYEEGDVIKRAVRDIYSSEMDEIVVSGEFGFKTCKNFMKILTPSHVRKVKEHNDAQPLFQRYGIESLLNALQEPVVQLPSGGYLVMNQTEALVAIDVNSGKATKERHIEDTALKTNLEAAEEVARQLRLRDMAGLVVIDFIDMEEPKHNNIVERKLKEAMRQDRARIQLSRISAFGLLELSRQRLRPSMGEISNMTCPHCNGTGMVRSPASVALSAIRALEEKAAAANAENFTLKLPLAAALYLMNERRTMLSEIESRNGTTVKVDVMPADQPTDFIVLVGDSETDSGGDDNRKRSDDRNGRNNNNRRRTNNEDRNNNNNRRGGRRKGPQTDDNEEEENVQPPVPAPAASDEQDDESERKKGRRRRGKRGGRRRRKGEEVEVSANETDAQNTDEASNASEDTVSENQEGDTQPNEEKPRRGRRRPKKTDEQLTDSSPEATASDVKSESSEPESKEEEKPKRPRSRRKPAETADVAETTKVESGTEEAAEKPKRRRTRKKADDEATGETPAVASPPSAESEKEKKPKRRTRKAAPAEDKVSSSEPSTEEEKPKRVRRPRKPKEEKASSSEAEASTAAPEAPAPKAPAPKPPVPEVPAVKAKEKPADKPKRRGWWQRG
ncbi:Rne/Rng family ribonuclease [Alphaproteobacteria bacterium]|nr:Rne/Rng family ribonuclease [Alphaproteobacteria bacterium]